MPCGRAPVEALKNQLTIFNFDYGTLVVDRNQEPVIFFLSGDNPVGEWAPEYFAALSTTSSAMVTARSSVVRRNGEIFVRYAHLNRVPTKLIGALSKYFVD